MGLLRPHSRLPLKKEGRKTKLNTFLSISRWVYEGNAFVLNRLLGFRKFQKQYLVYFQ